MTMPILPKIDAKVNFKRKKRLNNRLLLLSLILFILVTQLENNETVSIGLFIFLANAAFLFPIVILLFRSHLYKKILISYFREFAQINNFTFSKQDKLERSIFTHTRTGTIDVIGSVSGTYIYPFRLFNYETKIDKDIIFQTIFEFELPNDFETLLLVSKKCPMFLGTVDIMANGLQQTNLEGNFNEHFDLYIKPDSHISALTIFTPDTMLHFIDNKFPFIMKIDGKYIHIFSSSSPIETNSDLSSLFSGIDIICAHLMPKLTR
jgi:hypothetical protein